MQINKTDLRGNRQFEQTYNKEFELVTVIPQGKVQAQLASLVNSINIKRINTDSLQTLPKTKEEGILLNSFYEARIIMILNPDKGITGKDTADQTNINTDFKNPHQNSSK